MFKEDRYKNAFERFPKIESDLKVYDIPKFNKYDKNKLEEVRDVVETLVACVALGVLAYFNYIEWVGAGYRMGLRMAKRMIMPLVAVPLVTILWLVLLYLSVREFLKNRVSRKEIKNKEMTIWKALGDR